MDPISVESEKEECSDYKKKKGKKGKKKRSIRDVSVRLFSSRVLHTRHMFDIVLTACFHRADLSMISPQQFHQKVKRAALPLGAFRTEQFFSRLARSL